MYKIGTVATVKQVVKLPKGVVRILVEGEERAELLGFEPNDQWLEAEIEGFGHLEEKPLTENEEEAMIRNLRETLLHVLPVRSENQPGTGDADYGE